MIAGQRSGVSHIPCWLITDTRSFHRYVVGGHLPIPKIPGAPVPTGRTVPQAWLDSGWCVGGRRSTSWRSDRRAAGQLRRTAARFNELARKGHDDDFNRGDSVYDNYYGDPTLPNPNLYPLTTPPYLGVPDHPRRSRHIGRSAHRRARPGAALRRHGDRRAVRGGQHLRGGHGPQLCRCRGHHRPGHDVRLRRGQAHRRPSRKPRHPTDIRRIRRTSEVSNEDLAVLRVSAAAAVGVRTTSTSCSRTA